MGPSVKRAQCASSNDVGPSTFRLQRFFVTAHDAVFICSLDRNVREFMFCDTLGSSVTTPPINQFQIIQV